MKIREAKVEDIKYVKELSDKLMDCHLQFDEYYALCSSSDNAYNEFFNNLVNSEKAIVLVAEENHVIVGFLIGKIEERPPVFEVKRIGHIGSTYVLEECRNQGTGRRLTDMAVSWFKTKGIEYMELSVDSRNEQAYEVWKALGFSAWKILMKKKI